MVRETLADVREAVGFAERSDTFTAVFAVVFAAGLAVVRARGVFAVGSLRTVFFFCGVFAEFLMLFMIINPFSDKVGL